MTEEHAREHQALLTLRQISTQVTFHKNHVGCYFGRLDYLKAPTCVELLEMRRNLAAKNPVENQDE